MIAFGELLKSYITESGYTVYRLSKQTGIERTGIHRALSGQRILSEDAVFKLMDFLQLESLERDKLMEAYEIERMGAQTYYQRKIIRSIIEALTLACETPALEINTPKRIEVPENLFTNHTFLHGKYQIISQLGLLIEHELYQVDNPYIGLFIGHDQGFLNRIIPTYHPTKKSGSRSSLPVIEQLIPFSRQMVPDDTDILNLELLRTILPFSLTVGAKYHIYYYYTSCSYEFFDNLIFPYYIILKDCVVLLSADLQHAFLCRSEEYIDFYKKQFSEILKQSKQLVKEFTETSDIIEHFTGFPPLADRQYFIEYGPCILSSADSSILYHMLPADVPDRDFVLKYMEKDVTHLQSVDQPYFIFTQEGLELFMETGIITDFPEGFTLPLSPEDRMKILKRLYQSCVEETQVIEIMNPEGIAFPGNLSIRASDCYGVGFFLYHDKKSSHYLYLTEHTLTEAFTDFISSIADSSLVYPKKTTLEILENTIKKYSQ
jgi:plasmid maintenance system antidote protein VapI